MRKLQIISCHCINCEVFAKPGRRCLSRNGSTNLGKIGIEFVAVAPVIALADNCEPMFEVMTLAAHLVACLNDIPGLLSLGVDPLGKQVHSVPDFLCAQTFSENSSQIHATAHYEHGDQKDGADFREEHLGCDMQAVEICELEC